MISDWEKSFPRAAAYLEKLPDGLKSYPSCVTKATDLRDDIIRFPFVEQREIVPKLIGDLLETPPRSSAWIPEVAANAFNLMVREYYLQTEAQWEQWADDRTRKITRNPAYRFLFAFTSPRFLLATAAKRWSIFRRGTDLDILEMKKTSCIAALRTPAFLYEDCMLTSWQTSFKVLIEIAGGKRVFSEFQSDGSLTRFQMRWE